MRQFIAKVWHAIARLIYRRTILVLALLLCIGVAGALWNMSRLSSTLIESQAIRNATLYAQTIKQARTLYSSEVVNRASSIHGITVTHDYEAEEGAIPLPATFLMEFGHRLTESTPDVWVRLYSNYPFPWRQAEGGPQDAFEADALRYLEQHPEQNFFRFESFQGRQSLRYAMADVLQASCVGCHNTHPDSPKRDWQAGDVRGVLEITTPLDSFVAETRIGLSGTFAMLVLLSVLALAGLTLVISRLRQTSKELELRVIERTADLRNANAELAETNEKLAEEQEKTDRLLLNILPEPIARDLKEGNSNIADGFSGVTVLFADIVQFTQLSEQVSPVVMVELLNDIFSRFDRLTEKHGLEKIKTIGDAYMVAGGLPVPRPDHAEAVAEMALDMQQEMKQFNTEQDKAFKIRIGINTGPVVAGVIGTSKFIYDLWGDTVNVASRMESHGVEGEIQVAPATYECLNSRYIFESRGEIQVKGKGKIVAYLLKSRNPEAFYIEDPWK